MVPLHDLLARLSTGSDAQRAAAARDLAAYGEAAAEAAAAALPGADAETRWWLLAALAQVPGPAATAALSGVAARDPEEGLRAAAAQILGGHRAGSQVLLAALQDPSTFVALQAAHALAQMGDAQVPELITALREGEPRARIAAARALSALQAQAAIPALIAALDDDSPSVQFYAEEALARMGVGTILLDPGA